MEKNYLSSDFQKHITLFSINVKSNPCFEFNFLIVFENNYILNNWNLITHFIIDF